MTSPSEEVSQSEGPTCPFCFGSGGEMIAPCVCRGTLQWVHRTCVNQWRSHASDPNRCPNCKHRYRVATVPLSNWVVAGLREVSRWCAVLCITGVSEMVSDRVEDVVSQAAFQMCYLLGLMDNLLPEVLIAGCVVRCAVSTYVQAVILGVAGRYTQLPLLCEAEDEVAIDRVSSAVRSKLRTRMMLLGFGKPVRSFLHCCDLAVTTCMLPSLVDTLHTLAIQAKNRICREATTSARVLQISEYETFGEGEGEGEGRENAN